MAQWVKDPVLSLLWLGSIDGPGSIHDLGTSACLKHSQNKTKEKEKDSYDFIYMWNL